MANELMTRIAEHLTTEGAFVVVGTYTRATKYTAKHAGWFSANDREPGVYVQSGRRRLYVFPQYVRFGRIVKAAK